MITRSPRGEVICLFDENGLSAKDWLEDGYDVYCYDIVHTMASITWNGNTSHGKLIKMPWDATDDDANQAIIDRHQGRAVMVLAFPPCTDLAVSGAAWFESKRKKNPNFQIEALHLALTAKTIGESLRVPYAIENPVSVLSTLWRKPNYTFHPYEYGGYLPVNDIHPLFPDYIAPRDAYTKKTCYWTGGGFIMPLPKPVDKPEGYSTQHLKLGGKSEKTKRIRSASPRGIARAIYLANRGKRAISSNP